MQGDLYYFGYMNYLTQQQTIDRFGCSAGTFYNLFKKYEKHEKTAIINESGLKQIKEETLKKHFSKRKKKGSATVEDIYVLLKEQMKEKDKVIETLQRQILLFNGVLVQEKQEKKKLLPKKEKNKEIGIFSRIFKKACL